MTDELDEADIRKRVIEILNGEPLGMTSDDLHRLFPTVQRWRLVNILTVMARQGLLVTSVYGYQRPPR